MAAAKGLASGPEMMNDRFEIPDPTSEANWDRRPTEDEHRWLGGDRKALARAVRTERTAGS
ncbi:MAG: hypothetical protein U5O16_37115 [Rhodococcus sp. (in: high G+C Gram-positive bacteria)]|uniref:hypothetical protein n=1 Tax=Rhodococcus sp. TaxID=1831 RepID=UPI002AD72C91|nr:hypothetical protein [Rhodococcus sp. (in: high G+C Gram-positive bacteria)]